MGDNLLPPGTKWPGGVCGEEKHEQFLTTETLYDHDSEGYYPDPYHAPVCAECRRKKGLIE